MLPSDSHLRSLIDICFVFIDQDFDDGIVSTFSGNVKGSSIELQERKIQLNRIQVS